LGLAAVKFWTRKKFKGCNALNAQPAQEDVPGTKVAAHTRNKRGRKPLDPNLPREVVRHDLPEPERFCANDGHALVEIGVEISEQLDVIPEQVRVIQHQRVKRAFPCCDLSIKVTPVPPRIIPRGLFTESALAWIATSKYQFGMPLYRQAALRITAPLRRRHLGEYHRRQHGVRGPGRAAGDQPAARYAA